MLFDDHIDGYKPLPIARYRVNHNSAHMIYGLIFRLNADAAEADVNKWAHVRWMWKRGNLIIDTSLFAIENT